MSYNVSTFSGSKTVIVEDGTINNSLDIFLVGKNFSGYGEVQNQNLIYLLENFAGSQPPSNPLNGQLWYDTINKKIKVYDESISVWKSTTTEVSNTPPNGRSIGDLWWDSVNNQLYGYNGSSYVLIGPQSIPGFGTTQIKTITLNDINNNAYTVLASYVNDSVVFVVSNEEFELNLTSQLNLGGSTVFKNIKKGITLFNTTNEIDEGVTQGSSIIWGSSSNSLKLNGYSSTDFWLKSENDLTNFTDLIKLSDEGFTLGQDNDLSVFIQNGTSNLSEDGLVPIIRSNTSNIIKFQTLNFGNNYFTPLKLVGSNILPGISNLTDIGSSTLTFKDVYAQNFNGTLISSGADLAEKYLADKNYEPGTVVSIGGVAEITECNEDSIVLGVISDRPAHIMNSTLKNGINVALKGRILVKVIGKIKKGEPLKSYSNGCSIKSNDKNNFFAISLENNDQDTLKLIEAVIM